MIAEIVIGALSAVFGAAHVVFPEQMYAYYQRHFLWRLFSGSTKGAMRVHGAILTALGIVVILRAVLA